MNILSILIACLSYTTIIAICYTIFWGLTRHLFSKLKIYYEIFLGFVLGFISTFSIILISLLGGKTDNLGLTILLPTFLYWVSIIFISPISSIGILTCNILNLVVFSSLFGEYFGKPDDAWTITMLSMAYIIPFVNYLINIFWRKISDWSNWSIATIILLVIGLTWNLVTIKTPLGIANLTNLLFWLGSGYLAYAYIAVINQIYLHALKLQNIVTYDNLYYLNFSSAHEQILNKLQEEKIKYGIYLTYFISNFEKFESKVSGHIKEEVVNSISEESYNLIKENFDNAIFFKPNYKTFGAFIPLEMDENFSEKDNKYLKKIKNIFVQINTEFKIDNYKVSVKLKSVCSYYGLHSNNLDTLLEYNRHVANDFLLTYQEKNIVVNPMEIIKEKNQNKKMLSLNEVTNLNLFVTLFEPIYSSTQKDFVSYFLNGMIDGIEIDSDLFLEQNKLISDMGLSTLFLRYISFQSLKKFSKQKEQVKEKDFFIDYDSNFMASEDFDIEEFILKLKNLKINLDKLIFNFDLNIEVDNQKLLEKNINELKKHSIRTSVSNFGSIKTDFSLMSCYKPEFIFMEKEISKKINFIKENENIILESIKIANKLDAKIIATSVNSYIIYKHLRSLGIELFTGELIGSSIEPREMISDELRYLLNK
ncbi:EAL domain-containing protein [Spiroplasma endosymbiont of Diplazon laetatorius]|uniref:EAL domain-containing protein n=1 Tax=Spiroplasma endosymbiont of Diplazon laetatorius TaxID=3066322 RepID=UPI0030D13472